MRTDIGLEIRQAARMWLSLHGQWPEELFLSGDKAMEFAAWQSRTAFVPIPDTLRRLNGEGVVYAGIVVKERR